MDAKIKESITNLKKVLIVSGACLFSVLAFPQDLAMTFDYLTVEDGLSDNRIQVIYRDHKNFMWIGTSENGLNKFDGTNITIYEHNDIDTGTLSSNFVRCIFEDDNKNLWIGTSNGLNLYQPDKDNFNTYKHNPNNENSIGGNYISKVIQDKTGNLWIATEPGGLNKWDQLNNQFKQYRIGNNHNSNYITDIIEDSNGRIWVVTLSRGIYEFKTDSGVYIHYEDSVFSTGNFRKKLCEDLNGTIWIGTFGDGLYAFNPEDRKFKHYKASVNHGDLNSNMIRDLILDDPEHLLIATDQGGINKLNINNKTFSYIEGEKATVGKLNSNGVMTVYKDSEGILWVGTTRGGVNFYNPEKYKFKSYRHDPKNTNSLSHNVVGCFYEDSKGLIWIGTDGGGINVFDPQTNQFVHYIHDPNDKYSISGNVIRSITEDKQNNIWIATWDDGLNRFDRATGMFHHYFHEPDNDHSILSNTIWSLLIDSNNRLWIGSFDSGVDIFTKKEGVVRHLRANNMTTPSLSSNTINFIFEDELNNIWICTNYGINLFNFHLNSNKIYHFPDNNIRSFCKDKNGNLWAGSLNRGIYLFTRDGTVIKNYNKEDGLPDNTIQAIIEDNHANLWITTKRGLCKFNPEMEQFRIYTETDGLAGTNLFEQSYLKASDGKIYIGGYNGFNSFYPDSIKNNDYLPYVYLSDFKLFNKSVSFGLPNSILQKHISKTERIVLTWKQSVFSFEFSAVNFTSPEKNQYAYIMEGFEANWNFVGNKREATYTNLDPGEYIFRVKASNNDGIWNEEGASVMIKILPPLWKTIYAYVVYTLLVLGLILLSWQIIRDRERLKHSIELEKQKATRDRELDLMKIKFFTNISHEFRTPLSLIISPLNKLLKEAKEPEKQHLNLIFRNAKRLLILVNQLLDFRKIEVGQIKLNLAPYDIVNFSKDICLSFLDIAQNKNIKLNFRSNKEIMEVYFDGDKLEKILLNLLSNAFKFTPDNGNINFQLNVNENNPTNNNQVDIEIIVKDSGIGIPTDKQDKIFMRFFQDDLPENIINSGSGIGLSITNEFVRMHHGTITVESEPDKGSRFIVKLPLQIGKIKEDNSQGLNRNLNTPNISEKITEPLIKDNKPTLLLVEDNDDFRFYLKDNLKHNYKISEAGNGKEAWDIIIANIPDLIISDVMMPVMDGFELCRRIKSDKRICHVPVILLTAKSSSENKLAGIETGADDYIAKPFYFEILESRIKNLIHQRETLRNVFKKNITINPSEINITSLDEKFLMQTLSLVEKNIDNPDFSVVDLSKEIGISRAHLYQKLMAITGKSPIEFIRFIRLKRASKLLLESQLNVSEVAYSVGFNNPKLFTKYFKAEFGMTPSKYIQSNNN